MIYYSDRLSEMNNFTKSNKQLLFCEDINSTSQVGSPFTYSASHVLNANLQLERWARKINKMKIGNRELSPFEKYLCAYIIVTNFASYKLEEKYMSPAMSRSITSVLNDDLSQKTICCVGYANLLSSLCNRVGINCICSSERVDEQVNKQSSNHRVVTVYMDDPKYNLKGLYHSDPCNDSFIPEIKTSAFHYTLTPFYDYYTSYDYFCRPAIEDESIMSYTSRRLIFDDYPRNSTKKQDFDSFFANKDKIDFYKNIGIYPPDEEIEKNCQNTPIFSHLKM